jgi:lipopolysaccharide transport system permease protein
MSEPLLPHFNDLRFHLSRLWKSRFLLTLWLRYNIQARYTQTILGIMWIIMMPLSTAFVLALAFSEFLRIQFAVPFVAFFLTGLLPWGLFSQGILTGTRSVVSSLGLASQVNFPREVVVLLALGESLVDMVFTFAATLVINAFYGIWPNLYYIYLPLLLFILVCVLLGLMLFLSCLSVVIRDIPQLVAVILQLLFYVTPILYPTENIPDKFRILILLNPLASLIQAFRDVILYSRAPDIATLVYPLAVGLVLLYLGYNYFKAHEEHLVDHL